MDICGSWSGKASLEVSDAPRILIVEDSATVRAMLSQQLENQGMVVIHAGDGREGLEKALSGMFDLIVTDVEMPSMDGLTFCEHVKKNAATRSTPVIMLSSHDSDEDIERGFRAGASAYISKSKARDELLVTIERIMDAYSFHRSSTILVVDDSAVVRNMVKKGLEQAGFQVISAPNGQTALDCVEVTRPDLIISDIDMPVMNGIDFCKTLRATVDYASIPFVVMSANSDRAVMRQMLQWGASAYLVKPFNLEQLVITVEKLLSDNYLLMLKDRQRLEAEQRLFLASIASLSAALEARDSYTRGHSESVAKLACRIAKEMNIDQHEIDSLLTAVRLHDIGKIGIPDNILLKPGRLTKVEFEVIQSHPEVGTRILGMIPSMQKLLPVIRNHHERFDGKGYPDGLKGCQIPLWARITAVADTYDALTSDRPYRKGMEPEEAITVIKEVRGTQLCGDCADAFLEIINDGDGRN